MTETPQITLADLTEEELELLIGLLMVAVNADNLYSATEAEELKGIALDVGRERFFAASERLRERCPNTKSILGAVGEVTRPEARRVILDLVAKVSESDGLARAEENLLLWLAKKWELDQL